MKPLLADALRTESTSPALACRLYKSNGRGPLTESFTVWPFGTGDAQLTLTQTAPLTGAVIVTTPQDVALIDARKGLEMFRAVRVPVLGIVENMSYFVCPHCGGRTDIFAHGGARHEAERLGVPFLGEVPLDLAIRLNSDAGTPIVVADPSGAHAAVYRDIARRVWEGVERERGEGGRTAPRIVIE